MQHSDDTRRERDARALSRAELDQDEMRARDVAAQIMARGGGKDFFKTLQDLRLPYTEEQGDKTVVVQTSAVTLGLVAAFATCGYMRASMAVMDELDRRKEEGG